MTCYYGEELLLPPFQASAQLPKWPSLLFAFNHLSTSSFFHFSLWNLSFGKDTSSCEMRMRTSLLIIFRTIRGERAKKMPDWDMLWSFQPWLLKWSCISRSAWGRSQVSPCCCRTKKPRNACSSTNLEQHHSRKEGEHKCTEDSGNARGRVLKSSDWLVMTDAAWASTSSSYLLLAPLVHVWEDCAGVGNGGDIRGGKEGGVEKMAGL